MLDTVTAFEATIRSIDKREAISLTGTTIE
jgi:hypothetical protein